MKTIVVYYSLEGNSKYVADEIAKKLGADTLRLESKKAYPTGTMSKYFWGGKDVVMGETPELLPYQFHKKDYDVIILGTPVWAGRYAPPIKTFLKENDLKDKKIGLFACSASGNAEKCLQAIKQTIETQENTPFLSLTNPAKTLSQEDKQSIEKFCSEIESSL